MKRRVLFSVAVPLTLAVVAVTAVFEYAYRSMTARTFPPRLPALPQGWQGRRPSQRLHTLFGRGTT